MHKPTNPILIIVLFVFWLSSALGSQCLKSYQLPLRLPLSFGLEIEFDLIKNPRILEDYRSEKTSEQKWIGLSLAEKLQIISNKSKVKRLIKMNHAIDWLPTELRREATETFELSDVVFHSFSDWKKALEDAQSRYGVGAAQTHVVYNPHLVSGSLTGFVSFSGDLAQLNVLEKGYRKFIQNPEKIPGNNLNHFALGPMSGEGIVNTKKYEDQLRSKNNVSNEMGGKYFLSTVLRAGIYGDKSLAGFELRQFNFDYKGLEKEVKNTIALLHNNTLGEFKEYEEFHETHTEILERLHQQYPGVDLSWIQGLEQISDKDKNFYYNIIALFKDWKNHPILKTLPSNEQLRLRSLILEKESLLLADLNTVFAQNINFNQAQKKIRILMSKYFYDLKLSELFQREYEKILLKQAYSDAA